MIQKIELKKKVLIVMYRDFEERVSKINNIYTKPVEGPSQIGHWEETPVFPLGVEKNLHF